MPASARGETRRTAVLPPGRKPLDVWRRLRARDAARKRAREARYAAYLRRSALFSRRCARSLGTRPQRWFSCSHGAYSRQTFAARSSDDDESYSGAWGGTEREGCRGGRCAAPCSPPGGPLRADALVTLGVAAEPRGGEEAGPSAALEAPAASVRSLRPRPTPPTAALRRPSTASAHARKLAELTDLIDALPTPAGATEPLRDAGRALGWQPPPTSRAESFAGICGGR